MSAKISEIVALVLLIHTDRLYTTAYILACSYHRNQGQKSVDAQFSVQDIDFTLCTHYIYCSGRVDTDEQTIVPADPISEDGNGGTYKLFNDGKKTNPKVKTILSLGGVEPAHHLTFQTLYTKDNSFQTFATNALSFLRDKGFDGLNIHWQTSDEQTIRVAFPKLLTALKTSFENDYANNTLMLTMTGFAFPTIYQFYDLIVIQKSVDYIFMPMSQFVQDHYASFMDPLYYNPNNRIFHPALCVNASVENLWRAGMPHKKMVIGVTALGHYVKLQNSSNHEPGAPIDPYVAQGPKYQIQKRLAYPEICDMMSTSRRYYDNIQKKPYLFTETMWVGYTDTVSLGEKINYIKSRGISGMEFSLMDQDDFSGNACQSGKFPLLSFLKQELNPDPPTTVPPGTVRSTTTRTAITPTQQIHRPTTKAQQTSRPTTTTPQPKIETDEQHDWITYMILVLMFVVGVLLGVFLMRLARPKKRPHGEGE